MRGGFLHNTLLIQPFVDYFTQRSDQVLPEYQAGARPSDGAIDLLIVGDSFRLAIEAELTTQRMRQDLDKAQKAEATHLLILTPTSKLASMGRKLLSDHIIQYAPMQVQIFPLGPARHWVEQNFS